MKSTLSKFKEWSMIYMPYVMLFISVLYYIFDDPIKSLFWMLFLIYWVLMDTYVLLVKRREVINLYLTEDALRSLAEEKKQ